MLRKYENFIKSKEKNILNADKNKDDNSYNKNTLNQNRNKSKNKNKEKVRNNVFKTINILHNNKKYIKDSKEHKFFKNNKNEKITRLNLCCVLSNNIKNNNINNIKNYKNSLNNKKSTYNNLNNNSSSEDIRKEKGKNSQRNNCHWTKKIKIKKNKNKNLSHINITNLINNKYQINNSSLTKTKSTENINITKNIYNKSSDNESNFKNIFNKKIPLYENNFNFINSPNTKKRNSKIKKNSIFNKSKQKKNTNKIIKTNYNIYKSNSKSNKRKNRWTNSPGYRGIYKNSENIMSGIKKQKNCKTPISNKRLFHDNFSNYRFNKKESFNFYLFDNLCQKAECVLEKCKKSLEFQLKIKDNI